MIIIRKSLSERLQEQLEKEKEHNTKLAGYSLLPEGTPTQVKNVPESSKYKEPHNNSCMGFWEEVTGYEIKDDDVFYCPACNKKMSKSTKNLDGAHVYKPSSPNEWYFTPLCSECNNSVNDKLMTVSTPLVPVPPECYEEKDK